ncbi:peptidylprolyl isomerase [Raoultibacter phocaeensis]|uniref:peptidylprolyl isomerase n=1 Tax=Raoultibacter phocaeensis TaxID=2479841 RepID=UPI00111A69BC|nr:peptidylprolyl isomerase [Raoultibacter phocaeensis]
MRASTLARFVCAAGIASACIFGLAACSDSNPSGLTGGTAATVNGTEIAEDTVTTYIQSFRASKSLDTEDKWGEWLASGDMTPETVREQVIDYYASQELVKQGAKENNAEVSTEKIEEVISSMRGKYDSDEAWQQALTDAGTTEEAYRSSVELALTEQALKEAIAETNAPTDEELFEYSAMYDGARRSSHILFNAEDEATAQEVLDKINSGELDFVEAVKEYSQDSGTAEKDGDVGWDKMSSLISEYTTALSELDKDQVSGLVESQYGWHIIKCTDIFEVPEEGLTSTDQVPTEILDSVRATLEQQKFNEWFTTYKEEADIVINPMPESVPYNIDMSKYQTDEGTDEGATDGTEGGTDAGDGSTDGADAADGSADGSADGADANAADGGEGSDTPSDTADGSEGSAEGGTDSGEGASGNQQPAEAV